MAGTSAAENQGEVKRWPGCAQNWRLLVLQLSPTFVVTSSACQCSVVSEHANFRAAALACGLRGVKDERSFV